MLFNAIYTIASAASDAIVAAFTFHRDSATAPAQKPAQPIIINRAKLTAQPEPKAPAQFRIQNDKAGRRIAYQRIEGNWRRCKLAEVPEHYRH